MRPFEAHHEDLSRLERQSRRRGLIPRAGVDFSSNDYLGLAGSPELAQAARDALARGVPVGSGGSRLLRGNQAEHEALEDECAAFFGAEAALAFSTGFAANSALFSTLPQRDDLILYDELIHASAHEGMRIGRAQALAVPHNDAGAFENALFTWRKAGGTGQIWIAVESLYSMDGDCAPLAELAQIADRHQAMLLVDEAHATGVFGPRGQGLAHAIAGRENLITLHTFGKALGCEGAVICGPRVVRDFLINRARGFIFSTAASPLMAAIGRAAIALCRDAPEHREKLWALISHAKAVGLGASASQIVPIIIGDDARAMAVAARLQKGGFDVRGIRPPTVPEGTARLRIVLTLNAQAKDVTALSVALSDALLQAARA
jgi:8-amino-7-oxononanoate synthase